MTVLSLLLGGRGISLSPSITLASIDGATLCVVPLLLLLGGLGILSFSPSYTFASIDAAATLWAVRPRRRGGRGRDSVSESGEWAGEVGGR